MQVAFLSRFTPSLLPHEALENSFVQRPRLLDKIVAGLRESALTPNKHYYLVTGPRGIGKTHLVSLIYHRLHSRPDLAGRLRVAWLREEEWGVASYLDLLLVVLRALQEGGDDAELGGAYRDVRSLDDADAARAAAERLLIQAATDTTLLIIAENLDEIFRGIEREGQQQLRALLQNHPRFAVLGTAQSLFEDVTSRDEPFYGFFETLQLEELTFESGVELVTRIAEQKGDIDLRRLLASPLGRARMRAVHHLAAGNPRVYVVFSQFLTAQSLDELVQPLLRTLDDLTPYYQGRMAHLSPQQRKIVEFLCENRGAATVSGIAKACFIAPQTTSSQLRRIAELGYVRSAQIGRASYYELREPLLRLTLEVKKLRGGPVRLIVEFLRLWYSEQELAQRLGAAHVQLEKDYFEAAVALERQQGEDLLLKVCRSDLDRYVSLGETQQASEVAEEILAVGGSPADYDRIIQLPRAPHEQVARALALKGMNLLERDEAREAVEVYAEVVRRFGESVDAGLARQVATALLNKGIALGILGRTEEALAAFEEVDRRYGDRIENPLTEQVASALFNKGVALGILGRTEEALTAYEEVDRRYGDRSEVPLAELLARAIVNRGFALGSLERAEEELEAYDEVVQRYGDRREVALARNVASALANRGVALESLGRSDEALAACDQVVQRYGDQSQGRLTEEVAVALINKGAILAKMGQLDEAINAIEVAIGLGESGDGLRAELTAHARLQKGLLFGAILRIGDARKEVDAALRLFEDAEIEPQHSAVVPVAALLRSTGDPSRWSEAIEFFIDAFSRLNQLGELGIGLAHSVATLEREPVSIELAKQWCEAWTELGGSVERLQIPLRLLEAEVAYLAEHDTAALQALPAEERKILVDLLERGDGTPSDMARP